MGIEVVVDGPTKSFGKQTIWQDVTLTLPAGEVSVMLGPSPGPPPHDLPCPARQAILASIRGQR